MTVQELLDELLALDDADWQKTVVPDVSHVRVEGDRVILGTEIGRLP